MKFECAFICPEVLTVVGGPGYYPDHESLINAKSTSYPGGHVQSRRQIVTLKRPYLGLKKKYSAHNHFKMFKIVELC